MMSNDLFVSDVACESDFCLRFFRDRVLITNLAIIFVGLILILTQNQPSTEISETTSSPEAMLEETGEIIPKTPIEIAFDNAKDVEMVGEKAKKVENLNTSLSQSDKNFYEF